MRKKNATENCFYPGKYTELKLFLKELEELSLKG